MLELDFSIDIGVMDPVVVEQRFYDAINRQVAICADNYALDVPINAKNAMDSLVALAATINKKGGKLYTIVDEYDRFANKLMLENSKLYEDIVAGESGQAASSPIRAFFENLKAISKRENWSFATGLTPVALADASGANDRTDLSHDKRFADLCGFSEESIKNGLEQIALSCEQRNRALDLMRKYYNGYIFKGGSPVYNSTLCLYFLKKLAIEGASWLHEVENMPFEKQLIEMVDNNVNVSENVVNLIKQLPGGPRAVFDLAVGNGSDVDLLGSLRLSELRKSIDDEDQRQRLFSVMYYHGVVTRRAADDNTLVLPNEIARGHFMKQLSAAALDLETLASDIADPTVGKWESIVRKSFLKSAVARAVGEQQSDRGRCASGDWWGSFESVAPRGSWWRSQGRIVPCPFA